jgi:hypothetical protein
LDVPVFISIIISSTRDEVAATLSDFRAHV